jgi:hypothetical protein
MDWLSSAVSKIQTTIAESKEEFLAEQAKYCGDEPRPSPPPESASPRDAAAAASAPVTAAGAEGGGMEVGIEQAEAWLKERADKLKHVGFAMLNPLGDDEAGADGGVGGAGSSQLPWERADVSERTVAQMKALSKDHMAFLTLPPEHTSFSFDLEEAMPTILRLLQHDQQIERWRFLLVPKRCAPAQRGPRSQPAARPTSNRHPRARTHALQPARRTCASLPRRARRISEESFFRNYFFQQALLAGDVSPSSPASPASLPQVPEGAPLAAPPLASSQTLQRSATPSADSVGGSVVSVMAPSVSESEQFELISNEVLEGIGRSQLSKCADAVTQQPLSKRTVSAAAEEVAQPAPSVPPLPPKAPQPSEVKSWEDELQAELARIESGNER